MANSGQILVDSGRLPLWLRLPALVFGIACLVMGLFLGVFALFDLSFGIPLAGIQCSPLAGSLALLVIAFPWTFAWFAQYRIAFDSEQDELLLCTRGYFGWHTKPFLLMDSKAIRITEVRTGIVGTAWRLAIERADGHREKVFDIVSDIEPLVASLELAAAL